MPRGRHREEPVGRPRPRLPHPVAAAGIGVALLAAPLAITLWPHQGAGAAAHALAADSARRDAAADALRTATAFRAQERTSRDRTAAVSRSAPVQEVPPDTGTSHVLAPARQLWVTTYVDVRSGPSAGYDRIGSLQAGAQAGTTGATASGWTQVVTRGLDGWVRSSYLSRSKPAPRATPKPRPAPPSPGISSAPCSISPGIVPHLTPNARSVYRAVCAAFAGSVSAFGGYRPGDPGDHGSGRAVDIMVSGDPGLAIARFVQAHARELHVTYVIYQQKIWLAGRPTSEWRLMEDRGSRTANHYDHVHVSVS